MKTIYNLINVSVITLILFTSCGSEHSNDDGHGHGEEHGEHEEHEEGGEGIHLSKSQVETIGLEFGNFSKIKVNDFIKSTGKLDIPTSAQVTVTSKTEGIITGSALIMEGQYIKKGDILAYLENPEIIIKQQDYLQAKAELKYVEIELERQKELVGANAGILKTVQKLESDAAVKEIQLKGTAKYLGYLGISTSSLNSDNIKQKIAITSPISGLVDKVNLHDGMYVEPKTKLLNIINEEQAMLKLDVFEKDVSKIEIGQNISYQLPALGNEIYEAKISQIGKDFKGANKIINVYGTLDNKRSAFTKDLFINAKIWLNDNIVEALPENSVVRDGESSYIYVAKNDKNADEIMFKKIMIVPGATNNGFTAVKLLDEIPNGMEIVTKGAYYVYAQSKAGALTHEH